MLGHDVVRVAEGMSHQVVALTHDDLDVTDPAKVERLITRERPGAVINCAAWTNVDGAEESEHDASAGQRPGRRVRRGCRGQGRTPSSSTPPPTTSSTGLAGPTASPTTRIRSTPTARPSSAESEPRRWSTGAASSCGPRGSSGPTAATSSRRCCDWARAAARWWSSTIRSAAPPTRATSRSACCAWSTARPTASTTWPARAAAPGTSSRWRSSARPRSSRG